MAETPAGPAESNSSKAVKDRQCPFCHQAFTSSSLGRHLDIYIREKNPKPPDGLHDVVAIRKLRQHITRRQPKSTVSRRGTSASAGTPATVSRRSPASGDAEALAARSPLSQREDSQAAVAQIVRGYPFNTPWEATGVINDLSAREGAASRDDRRNSEGDGAGRGLRSGPAQRSVNRHTLKQQLDTRQQIQDAQDTSRAAELALRELLSSLRAAKSVFPSSSRP